MDVKIFYQPLSSVDYRDRRMSIEHLEGQVKEWLVKQQNDGRTVRVNSIVQDMTDREIVLTVFYSLGSLDVSKI